MIQTRAIVSVGPGRMDPKFRALQLKKGQPRECGAEITDHGNRSGKLH
jgi:hypothetical protein